jgi:hypothetical protein
MLRKIILFPLFVGALFTTAPAADWRTLPLIKDGKIAPEWQHVGWGKMVVERDSVRTEPEEKGLGVLVYTKEKFGDCQIRIVYRPDDERDNSGVHVRMDDGVLSWIGRESIAVKRDAAGKLSPEMVARMSEASEKENGAWYAVHHGFEVQIMDSGDEFHRTGSIYSYATAAALPKAPGDGWRTMIITLRGSVVLVELDGKQLTRFDSAAKDLPARQKWHEPKRDVTRPTHGYFGLQVHDPGDRVHFKEVSVRPL